ncbi:hypothetical protein SAY87_030231 [Trapa incisa]|uniref:Protein NUCLEAR FUSION DEFECTIVE 6, chloroplastic/mitochondrial n=1 Tax=Trapa incisa TaxID=236973 RepID=A0AAN7QJN2_9MYRT|nr:hypothetical protein SAY87_030231 [Trapa incisa]
MASACGRFVRRTSVALNSAVRSNPRPASASRSAGFTLPSKSNSCPARPSSLIRERNALGCVQSLLPLHSAVAVARMTSCLSTISRSSRALSQGTLCCTSPGL